MEPSSDLLSRLYRSARTIREFDARFRKGLGSGEFQASYWPVEGQEAISAGVCEALETDDRMVITYRCVADAVAKGIDLRELAGELLGREVGTSGGRGGAMGINAPEAGIVAATGIVGSGPPMANGFALASQLQADGRVTVVSFGDGATSIGAVHEAMNLAALWDSPIVFLCHNNLYGEGTPIAEYTKTEKLADRAAGYGMEGVTVDGTDAVAVYEAAQRAVERARAGQGPTFLEAVAFRLNGHFFGDPCAYVDQEALEAARANEPIGKLRARLIASGIDESEVAALEASIKDEVETAIANARDADMPAGETLYQHVYGGLEGDGSLVSGSAAAQATEATDVGPEKDLTVAQAINQSLEQALERDERVVLLGEDIADPVGGLFTCTAGLSTKFGTDRVRATPIAEQAIVGAAVGAAAAGLRPVPELMFMDFLTVGMDQIVNHAAKLRFMSGGRTRVPLTVRTMEGAFNGPQHSQALEVWLLHTPGLKVAVPSTPRDAKGLLTACIEDDDPCVFIEPMQLLLARQQRGPVPEGEFRIPLGRADIKRAGQDATIVSWGAPVQLSLQAADALAKEGLDVEVVDLRTLLPLDLETIVASVSKTRRLVVAHSASTFCGFGAEIAALVSKHCFGELVAPVERVGAAFTPVPRAGSLVAAHSPGIEDIAGAIKRSCA